MNGGDGIGGVVVGRGSSVAVVVALFVLSGRGASDDESMAHTLSLAKNR